MSLKETIPQHCNAVLSAGKNSRNSVTDSLVSSSSIKRTNSVSGNPKPVTQVSKNALNQRSFSCVSSPQSKTLYKDKSTVNVCHCSDCTNVDDIPKHYLQELKDEIQTLQSDLSRQRNDNQVLKKHLLVAKWVVNKEIGIDKDEDFDSLMKKACDERWKGRQEMIFDLQKKLRELNETVERMESELKVTPSRKRFKPTKGKFSEEFSDVRTVFWCLELERQDVWKNAEREKQKVITSRDVMKNKLESLITRNEELVKEVGNLREKLATARKDCDEELAERLQELENRLKVQLKEKAEGIQKLEDLEQQVCRGYKSIAEFKENICLEKQKLKISEVKLKSLKADEANLHLKSEEAKKEKCKQSTTVRKKLQEIEQKYNNVIIKSEKVIKLIEDAKQPLEKLKPFLMKVSFNSRKHRSLSQCALKNGNNEDQLRKYGKSELSIELDQNPFQAHENKLTRYKTIFRSLENRNQDKLRILYSMLNKIKNENFTLLRNRCVNWELMQDTNVLRIRLKKLRKAVIHPTKKKLVKKKDSSLHLNETLEERKVILAIRKTESKFLKTVITDTFDNKEEDYEILEGFLSKNRYHFLKDLLKVRKELLPLAAVNKSAFFEMHFH